MRMDTWEFKLNGAWYWQRVDSETHLVLEQSDEEFSTLLQCVKDAHRHGYTVPYDAVCTGFLANAAIPPGCLRPPTSTRY